MTLRKKKFLVFGAVTLLSIGILAVGALYLTRSDERRALELAVETARATLQNPSEQIRLGMPKNSALESDAPIDTNLYMKTWNYLFAIKPTGYLEVWIYAPRGLPFLPIFNRKADLQMNKLSYVVQ